MNNNVTMITIDEKQTSGITIKSLKTTRSRLYAQWVKENNRLVMKWTSE